jgi:osmoprotectant transport system permease protein
VIDFVRDRFDQILFSSWQHFSLVVQCLIISTVLAVVVAALVYRSPRLTAAANSVSAIGLTIPAFALVGLLIAPFGFGVLPAVVVVVFFAVLPILRNAVVGLTSIDGTVIESAKGVGLSRFQTLWRIEIPLAWPVILTGVRVSAQMVMGIAAITAYVLGPGLGGLIFTGLARLGGANAIESVVVGTVAVMILALLLDLLLVGLGRLTIPRGIRV